MKELEFRKDGYPIIPQKDLNKVYYLEVKDFHKTKITIKEIDKNTYYLTVTYKPTPEIEVDLIDISKIISAKIKDQLIEYYEREFNENI